MNKAFCRAGLNLAMTSPRHRSRVLQTSQKLPSVGSQTRGIKQNADGSYDIYFAPTPPEGFENNWLETVPGKGWFVALRVYGPLEPWIEKTWRPGEIELLRNALESPAEPLGR